MSWKNKFVSKSPIRQNGDPLKPGSFSDVQPGSYGVKPTVKTKASMKTCRFFTPVFDDDEPPPLIDDTSDDERLQCAAKAVAKKNALAMVRPAMFYLNRRKLTFSQQDIRKSVSDETTPPYQPRNKKHVPHRTDEDGNVTFDDQDTIENFSYKIAQAKIAQVTEDFMVIARVESLILGKGMEDAVARAKAYLLAGADGIMIHSREKDPAEIFEFCRQYKEIPNRKPLVAVPSSYNTVTEDELQDAGVNIVIYANQLLRSAYPAMQQTAQSILTHQRSAECDRQMMPIKQILELIPGTK